MKTATLKLLLFVVCNATQSSNQLDAFKDLARRYYQIQNNTSQAPTQPPAETSDNSIPNNETTDQSVAENGPKVVQFALRNENKIREFKQVEGANDGEKHQLLTKILQLGFLPRYLIPQHAQAGLMMTIMIQMQLVQDGQRLKTQTKTKDLQ